MAKKCADSVLDSALDKIAEATSMIALASEPADRAAALSGALATATMVGGDYTNSNGDADGRKVAVAQKSGINVDVTGDATHVALIDGVELIYVTTCTLQTLTLGNTMTFPTWDVEIADPV